jgi:transcriptional regulator with XRE-family HTH domain
MSSSFGVYFRELRKRKGQTLRAFCQVNSFDPGNISRLERGLISPPESQAKLEQYAKALGLKNGSREWVEFFDRAAATRRQLPVDLVGDKKVLDQLPALFHTLRTGRVEGRAKMRWIDGSDLDLWANRRECQGEIPRLVRRLIHATTLQPKRVEFRAGEGVQLPEWDGIVETSDGNSYVPTGASFWEIGTSESVNTKANDDFEKRTANPLGADRQKSTFVFVTPRRWASKNKWAAKKKSQGDWADVRAYDGDDLEQWLELAPSVGAWFGRYVGKYPPKGIQSLEDFWREFAVATSPTLSSSVPLAGREVAVKQLQEWLRSGSGILPVHGESTAEVIAFISAVVEQLEDEGLVQRAARSLIVDDIAVVREIIATRNSLLLIWNIAETEVVQSAIERGHSVILPEGRTGIPMSKEGIELPRLSTDGLAKALAQCGLEDVRAREVVRATGGHLQPLRRQLARVPNLARPQWAFPDYASRLLRLLFAGSWDERQDGDRDIVGRLSQLPWEAVAELATKNIRGNDPPLKCAGGIWRFVSPYDAWHLLGGFVGLQDLDRFVGIAVEVLSQESSRLELPPDRRWMATDAAFHLSHALREGLAQSTALLAVLGEQGVIGNRAQDFSKRIVFKLLDDNAGWQRWYSLAGLLPYLAEAAPDEFLLALDRFLTMDSASASRLFEEEGPFPGGSSPHIYILWSLERLAWLPRYLGHVTVILGRLAALHPDGKSANHPARSLAEIFVLWHPNTGANLDERLQAVDLLLDREPNVGWDLLISLLPQFPSFTMPTPTPDWREYPVTSPVTFGEHLRGIQDVIVRALRASGCNADRIAILIKECASWPSESRTALADHIRSFCSSNQDPLDRNKVWQALRELVNTHRAFATADWALAEVEIKKLEELIPLVEPSDVFAKFKWLFDDWYPRLPGSGIDVLEGQKEIDRRRMEAAREIMVERGVAGLIALARTTKYPGLVGQAASSLSPADAAEEEFLISTLGSSEDCLRVFSIGFVEDRYRRMGDAWVDRRLPLIRGDAGTLATFFLALPTSRYVWNRVASEGQEVERLYWKEVRPYLGNSEDLSDIQFAFERLYAAQRVDLVAHIAGMNVSRFPGCDLVKVLDSLAAALFEKHVVLNQDIAFSTTEILSSLPSKADVSEEIIARLEWTFLPLLHHGRLAGSLALHRKLSSDPAFFAEVIGLVYRPQSKEKEGDGPKELTEPSEEQRAKAHLGYDLLSSWRLVPGSASDGRLNGPTLKDWVEQARTLCGRSGHGDIGDVHIGQVLAFAPAGPDGLWPNESARFVLEQEDSGRVGDGFRTGVFNSRGVVTKNIDEGGKQERNLADRFRRHAEALNLKSPRTAGLLRSIADQYDRMGHWEDETSTLEA